MNTNDLMGDLNEEQAAAVMLPLDTNVLIVAGAGTGKTTTLSRRVVHLLRSGVLASRVICCTFTNKATNEMRERIAKYAGEDQASRVRVSTLHALAGRIVGTHYRLLNIERRPLPLDEAASVKLMVHAWQSRSSSVSHDLVSDIALLGDAIEASSGMGSVRRQLRALHLITEDPSAPGKSRQLNSLEDLLAAAEAALKDVRSRERAYAVAALSVIERLQLQGLWPVQRILDMGAEGTRAVIASMISEKERDLFVENEGGDAASIGRFLEIYDLYMEAKKARSVMDFGDMVIMATRLMRDHPDVLSSYQDRYDYLMVDECQDLNSEQYAFIRVLSGDGKRMRVLMVGDQDQSIYAFRGANCMLMDEPFIRTFGARVVKLTRNYRSVPQIVKLSNKAISMNVKRIPKDLVPHSTKSGVVCAKEFATDRIADPWMVNQIGRSISMANISPSEIAILSRRNDDLLSTARALTVAGIPNRIIGAAHMFESPAVREALNWAILCLRNDRDDLVGGCLSAPSVGLGEVSIAALEGDALAAGMSCLEFLQNPPRSLRKAEMAALEQEGYLVQPHTSAGRIPTDKGYRFFVDHLARPGVLGPSERQKVRRFFEQVHGEMEVLLEQASGLLTELTSYTAVVVGPSHEAATIRSVQLVGLSSEVALAVVVLSDGAVEKRTVELDGEHGEDVLAAASAHLHAALHGRRLPSLAGHDAPDVGARDGDGGQGPRAARPVDGDPTVRRVVDRATLALAELGRGAEPDQVFVGGSAQLARSFEAVETVRNVLSTLEHQMVMVTLIREVLDRGLSVAIGSEHGYEPLALCALVAAPLQVDGADVGAVGLLGPTRMHYPQALAAAHVVGERLGERITRATGA